MEQEGNAPFSDSVFVEDTTPQENEQQPAEAIEESTEAKPEEAAPETTSIVELADGRKLTPDQLKDEYVKLNSEFTRRSQRLSDYERQQQPQTTHSQPTQEAYEKPWDDPNWVPQTYSEMARAGAEQYRREMAQEAQAQEQARQEVTSRVDAELSQLKSANPNLDETRLFEHAAKWKFSSLHTAYENMQAMGSATKAAEQRTAANLANRAAIPIAGKPSAANAPSTGADLGTIRSMSAQEALSQYKNK